jgi:hypothetical protein
VNTPAYRSNVIVMGALAALFTALYKGLDNVSVHNVFVASDRLTAAFAYLVVGSWTGAIFGLLLALLFGRLLIDPHFKTLAFHNKRMHISAFLSGGLSAVSTLFLLLGNQFGDPGALAALGSGVFIYTTIYDLWKGNATLKHLIPIAMGIAGGSLAAFSGSLAFTFAGIFFVLVISNGITAFCEIAEQKGTQASDPVSLFVWRFFWLALTGTLLATVVSTLRGYQGLLVATILKGLPSFWLILITMFFVFFAISLKLVLKMKNAVSLVLLILSAQIALAIPITIIGECIHPGIFGKVPHDETIWAIRLTGAVLLMWSIIILRYISPSKPIAKLFDT